MKLSAIAVGMAAVLLIAAGAFAGCPDAPKDGIYTTTNGTMIGGRASEAWCSGVGPGQPGNTESAASWDGATLGSQWRVWGMAIDAAGAIETSRWFDAFGNGYIDYTTNYTGGQFWLSGDHVWGNGMSDFTGMVTYFNVAARVSYVGWEPVGVTSNILMRGSFVECPVCTIEYAISNAMLVWRTGYPTAAPSDYPAFECGASAGELFEVCCVTAKIFCTPVSTETSTWGGIKGLFR